MTAYSKFPGYIDIASHSPWGTHHMQLKTRAWNPVGVTGDLGSFTAWDGTTVDAEVMVDNMVAKLRAFYLDTYQFDAATVYTIGSVGAPAIPVAGKALTAVGALATGEHAKAVQQTWTFRDTSWNVCRLTLLDAPTAPDWEPVTDITGFTIAEDLVDAFTASGAAWASLADAQPFTFRKITYDMSDVLRKKYGMA